MRTFNVIALLTASVPMTPGQLKDFVQLTSTPESSAVCVIGKEKVKPRGRRRPDRPSFVTKSRMHEARKSNS